MKLSIPQKAYIAGIVDGEGSLTIHKQRTGGMGYVVKLDVGNTCKEVIDYLQELFPGTVGEYYKDPSIRRKTHWIWRIHARKIRELLPQILPYMIIKRDLAKIFMRYLSITKPGNHKSNRNKEREILIKEIKLRNKKNKPLGE